MDAAFEAAFSWDSSCRAIPTSEEAKDGASFIPSPTYENPKAGEI